MEELIKKQYYLFNTNRDIIDSVIKNKIIVYSNISKLNLNINEDIEYFDLENVIWKYNENNYRIPYLKDTQILYLKDAKIPYLKDAKIPYLKDTQILYYKLKDTDNIYNYLSLHSLILDNDIITGEKIQYLADIVLGHPSSLNFNPNNNNYSQQLISIAEIENIDNYKSIFVFTHDLKLFYTKFKNKTFNKLIITHNSDHEINKEYNFKTHLCQNLLKNFNNTYAIPIGIENTQWLDHNIFYTIKNTKINKIKNIYFYFNINTHISRIDCYNKLKNKLEWNTKKNKYEYFIELASHKYAICPRGNGLDTHRIWECLYLNVIPIVIKSDFINIDNLPIIILNNWDELDPYNIINEFSNQQIIKLSLAFYKENYFK